MKTEVWQLGGGSVTNIRLNSLLFLLVCMFKYLKQKCLFVCLNVCSISIYWSNSLFSEKCLIEGLIILTQTICLLVLLNLFVSKVFVYSPASPWLLPLQLPLGDCGPHPSSTPYITHRRSHLFHSSHCSPPSYTFSLLKPLLSSFTSVFSPLFALPLHRPLLSSFTSICFPPSPAFALPSTSP